MVIGFKSRSSGHDSYNSTGQANDKPGLGAAMVHEARSLDDDNDRYDDLFGDKKILAKEASIRIITTFCGFDDEDDDSVNCKKHKCHSFHQCQ